MELSLTEIANKHMFVVTLEKWDVVTSFWEMLASPPRLAALVRLLSIDKVHLLRCMESCMCEVLAGWGCARD